MYMYEWSVWICWSISCSKSFGGDLLRCTVSSPFSISASAKSMFLLSGVVCSSFSHWSLRMVSLCFPSSVSGFFLSLFLSKWCVFTLESAMAYFLKLAWLSALVFEPKPLCMYMYVYMCFTVYRCVYIYINSTMYNMCVYIYIYLYIYVVSFINQHM